MNKIRYACSKYDNPRDFSPTLIEEVAKYDRSVIERYVDNLKKYIKTDNPLTGKNILDLGVGADLGVGVLALAAGANNYCGLDINRLIDDTPWALYEKLTEKQKNKKEILNDLHQEIKFKKGKKIHYAVDQNFSPKIFNTKFDIITSQAAFEHFDNPNTVISNMACVCESGAILIALVDLKTHTRKIKDIDPLNIYRYPDWLYRFFHFSGIPNRWRPKDYKNALEQNGFKNIKINTLDALPKQKRNGRLGNFDYRDQEITVQRLIIRS